MKEDYTDYTDSNRDIILLSEEYLFLLESLELQKLLIIEREIREVYYEEF